jgi:hypothetical protein
MDNDSFSIKFLPVWLKVAVVILSVSALIGSATIGPINEIDPIT